MLKFHHLSSHNVVFLIPMVAKKNKKTTGLAHVDNMSDQSKVCQTYLFKLRNKSSNDVTLGN